MLFVLIIFVVAAAVSKTWWLVFILGVPIFLGAGLIWGSGGFQKCPKCRSRLTEQIHSETPDVSHGYSRMHPRVMQKCWNPWCWKTTVLVGLVFRRPGDDDE